MKNVWSEINKGGDVTDFFVRLGQSREKFLALLESAQPAPRLIEVQQGPRVKAEERPWSDRVSRLKEAVPITEVIKRYVQLHVSGPRFRGQCPFHIDREPSLVVFPMQGRFHCFGCGADGDVITFLMTIEHLTFRQVLDALEAFYDRHDDPAQDHQ